MPTNAGQLVSEARRLERLQRARRKLRAELRRLDKEIKLSQKHIRALARADVDPFDQVPPMRFEPTNPKQ